MAIIDGGDQGTRAWAAIVRAHTLARRFLLAAICAAAYGLLAVVGALVQGHRTGHLAGALYPERTITWLVWWAVTAVGAVAIGAACLVGAAVLRSLASNLAATTRAYPPAGGEDHYR